MLLGLTVALVPAAEFVRLAGGWALNDEWTPAVVGPGDGAWVWFPAYVESIKGHWRATSVSARVVDPQKKDAFHEQEQQFTHTAELHLAAPRAGLVHETFWYLGALGGAGLFSLGGVYFLVRARALKLLAPPTRLVPLDDDCEEPVPLKVAEEAKEIPAPAAERPWDEATT